MASPLTAPLVAWLSKLSYPRMFLVVGCLFVVNLFIPDPLILIDELLLGLATLMLAKWKRRKPDAAAAHAPRDGDARRR